MVDRGRLPPSGALRAAQVPDVIVVQGAQLTHTIDERYTSSHQSISEELKMVAIEQAKAQVSIAQYKHAVPAQQQTHQVLIIGVTLTAVVGGGIYGAIMAPTAAPAIAGMVSVIGIVFGGVYYVTKKPKGDEQ